MESKKKIYDLMPAEYIPQTLFFKKDAAAGEVITAVSASGIRYPCIAKPDIGCKGMGVQKIYSDEDIKAYVKRINMNFLIQEFIAWPQEAGVFYCRMPGEEEGFISGIVSKEFLIIRGDGLSTITQLLMKDPRYHFQLGALQKIYGDELDTVLPKGEAKNMVPYGNHARGAKFVDVSHWADEKFTRQLNVICKQVPEFYFGRLDIMYDTFEAFKEGRRFTIVELNGAGSEPTHIYDPRHSVFFAWGEIARHFKLLYQISVKNHQRGFRYLTVKEGLQMLRDNKAVIRNLKNF